MNAPDHSSLANTISVALAPYFARLAARPGELHPSDVPIGVSQLWDLVSPKIKTDQNIQSVLRESRGVSENSVVLTEFRSWLHRVFEQDPFFAQKMQSALRFLDQVPPAAKGSTEKSELDPKVEELSKLSLSIQGSVINSVVIVGNGDMVETGRTDHQAAPSEEALRHSYLNHLFNTTNFLSPIDPVFASSENKTRLGLAAVYTALFTETSATEVLNDSRRPNSPDKMSALQCLNQYPHLALHGEPGSGKSTFANFVCMCLAGELLGRQDANLLRLTAPLQDKFKDRPQSWAHGPLLPVHVALQDFATAQLTSTKEGATAEQLWSFIADRLKQAAIGEFAPVLRAHLFNHGGLVVLDGMDEVPSAKGHRERVKVIIDDFASSLPRCRILVTSRSYAYEKQDWRLQHFAEAILAPFDRSQINYFIDHWYQDYAAKGLTSIADARGRAHLLKEAIAYNERLMDLAQRPLLLTLIVSLHAARGGDLPEERQALYASTVQLLLDWWESRKINLDERGDASIQHISLSAWLKVDRTQVRKFLEELAFRVHSEDADLAGTADITDQMLASGLLRLGEHANINPNDLLDYLRRRAGLLVPRGVGIYAFPHRAIQEYLAACYLTDHKYPYLVAELARQDPSRWREVAMLTGAKAGSGTSFAVWALAEQLCFQEPESGKTTEQDEWGALLAAQLLGESANLDNLSQPDIKKKNLICRWLISLIRRGEFSSVELVRAAENLALLGDLRFREDFLDLPDEPLLAFVEVPGGPFNMGSDLGHDRDSSDDERPYHEIVLPTYYLARYPVTIGQWKAFIRGSGYQKHDPRSISGLDNCPVAYVTWLDALAYSQWLEEMLQQSPLVPPKLVTLLRDGWHITLPSESEWEKAARGDTGRIYPWGNRFDENNTNIGETGIGHVSPVGCFPEGASPYGILDMGGNVWEWTRSLKWPYPYVAEDGRESKAVEGARVLRGGSFDDLRRASRCASRDSFISTGKQAYYGFRIALIPPVTGTI